MQIDFYILDNNSKRTINQMVCRLCEKALQQQLSVLVYAKSLEQAQQIDELLWTFKANSFIPHKNQLTEHEPNDEITSSFFYPVLICTEAAIANTKKRFDHYQQLLINLTSEPPAFFPQFNRVAELVDKNDDEKEKARNRYRTYRQQGYDLKKYDL